MTGYTLESPGNTHAEQSCFIKLADLHGIQAESAEEKLGPYLPEDAVLFTTMEPCNQRSPGNLTCVDRILKLKRSDGSQAIRIVVYGVGEPEKFVGENTGRRRLQDAGIEVRHVEGLEKEILSVATSGHMQEQKAEP